MCYVSQYYVVMSHEGGFLSCWDVTTKLKNTAFIKSLAAGEVTSIEQSPNVQEREVIIASTKGCIFVRVTNDGEIIEELFEIYFALKQLSYIGFINFQNYFATTKSSKQVLHFQRAYDNNKEFKTRELRLVEWTKNYVPLQDNNDTQTNHFMIGGSGSKLYLHNFVDEVSYILQDNLVWNLKTDFIVVELKESHNQYCESLNQK